MFDGLTVILTKKETEEAVYLYDIYLKELAGFADMESNQLKKLNYLCLFELGCHSNSPLISKLLLDGSNMACNLIVATGYVSNRS